MLRLVSGLAGREREREERRRESEKGRERERGSGSTMGRLSIDGFRH